MTAAIGAIALLLAAVPQPFRFADPEITESSAIVAVGGTYFTINDSGDSARVFAVDRRGRTVGVTTYHADVRDVEALAVGTDSTLLVGDIGDNDAERDHITVYRVPLFRSGNHDVRGTAYDLVYADGPRDAETLLVHPMTGRVFVVSKGLLGGTVYVAPRRLRSDRINVLRPVGDAPGLVTDGAFFPDGRHVVLRDYAAASVLDRRDWSLLGLFRLPTQPQGEGIDVVGRSVVISTEGRFSSVLFERVPARLRNAMGSQEPQKAVPPKTPAPVSVAREPASPEDGDYVPVALGAAGVLLLGLLVRASRRRSRCTP